jgi:hypothetical protein
MEYYVLRPEDIAKDIDKLIPKSVRLLEDTFEQKFGKTPMLAKNQTYEEYEAALKESLEAGEIRGVRLLSRDRSVIVD